MKHVPYHLDDYPYPREEEYKPCIEVVIAQDAVQEAEDTLEALNLAEQWAVAPEVAVQIIADSMTPGATFGETVKKLLEEMT